MHIYRIGQTKYANDLTGSGVDGRWNPSGQYVIYTGGSLALSCLEKLAHSSGTSLYAGNFAVTIYHIADKLQIKEITLTQLQRLTPEWNSVNNYPLTQAMGLRWLQ